MSSLLASTPKTYPASLVINCETASISDSSSYNHTINLNNGATYDTTNKYINFDGTNDYISIADSASLGMGTSDFTAECWVYPEEYSTNGSDLSALIENRTSTSSGGFLLWLAADSKFVFYTSADDNATQRAVSSLSSAILNRWTHVAGVRSNGVLKLYVNGILHGTDTGASGSPDNLSPSNSSSILLGTAIDGPGGYRNLKGKLDNIRIVKGIALYDKQFSPPSRENSLSKNSITLPNTVGHLILTTTKSSGSVSGTITTTSSYYTVQWWDGTKNTYSSGSSFSKTAVGGSQVFYVYPSTSAGVINGYILQSTLSNNNITNIRAPYSAYLSQPGTIGTTGGTWQFYGYPYYYSIFVPGNSIFIPGAAYVLDISNNSLSASALNQLYSDLIDGDGSINITGNTGSSSDNASIATNKGYTIIGG
jgi:hypothetical protein